MVDGGLATELERAGHRLDSDLWSAELLIRAPEAIREVHLAYLRAGADCLISASYQASIEVFMSLGMSEGGAADLLCRSVQLACEARELHEAESQAMMPRRRPLVAASVGPYGAFLANGAEYTGDYGVSQVRLRDFHRARWEILLDSGADLLACETIPSALEATVLRELIEESPQMPVWVSFTCPDDEHISDGTPVADCAAEFAHCENVVAVGVNCSSPQVCGALARRIRLAVPGKEAVLYPNSGEAYDAEQGAWEASEGAEDLVATARGWHGDGARLIGGCCRTRPDDIRRLGEALRR